MAMQQRMPDACAQLSCSERARCIPGRVCDMSEQIRDPVRIPDRESTGEPSMASFSADKWALERECGIGLDLRMVILVK